MKQKSVKPTISNSPNICQIHLKTHKLENIHYHHLAKKNHQTVNFCYKKSQPSEKSHKTVNLCYK